MKQYPKIKKPSRFTSQEVGSMYRNETRGGIRGYQKHNNPKTIRKGDGPDREELAVLMAGEAYNRQ